MKIVRINLFELEGPPRSGLALYEIDRGGLAPNQSTPYRQAFVEVETDEGLTGLAQHDKGASEEVKALGRTLIGEDPLRFEAIWDRLYTSGYQRGGNLRTLSTLDLALWDLIGKARNAPVYRLLGGPCQDRVRARVKAAREVKRVRFERAALEGAEGGTVPSGRRLTCNADMGPAEVRVFCEVDAAGKALLRAALRRAAMQDPRRCGRAHVGAGVPPDSETSADDRGPGGERADPDPAPDQGDAIARRSSTDRGGSSEIGRNAIVNTYRLC